MKTSATLFEEDTELISITKSDLMRFIRVANKAIVDFEENLKLEAKFNLRKAKTANRERRQQTLLVSQANTAKFNRANTATGGASSKEQQKAQESEEKGEEKESDESSGSGSGSEENSERCDALSICELLFFSFYALFVIIYWRVVLLDIVKVLSFVHLFSAPFFRSDSESHGSESDASHSDFSTPGHSAQSSPRKGGTGEMRGGWLATQRLTNKCLQHHEILLHFFHLL
jgi:cobalamin biosynthesis Mg chelatase CobN